MTVINGDNPLMVWTRDTGMRAIASEFRMWPPIWKTVNGKVVRMSSLLGRRIGYLRAGTMVCSAGKRWARADAIKHHEETKANWTRVKVTGFRNAIRIDLEEAFENIEVMNQKQQRTFGKPSVKDSAARFMCTYNEPRGDGRLQSLSELVCIVGNTSPTSVDDAQRLAETLLSSSPSAIERICTLENGAAGLASSPSRFSRGSIGIGCGVCRCVPMVFFGDSVFFVLAFCIAR